MKGIIGSVLVASILVSGVCLTGCAGMQAQDSGLEGGELQILSHSLNVHEFSGGTVQSTAVVSGSVKNVGSSDIDFASIIVDFYDKDGKLIDTSPASRENLEAGRVWDFSVQSTGPDAWKIVDYDIRSSAKQ